MRRVCSFVLFYAALNIVVAEDEWIDIKKKDLCPALHEEAVCTGHFINFDEVAEQIEKMGSKEIISDKQAKKGEDASKCGDPLKKAFCSSDAKAFCLEDKKTLGDDSAERSVCNKLYQKCPSLSTTPSLKYTEKCVQYLKRQYSDITCKSVVDFEKGGCPKPTRKMPEFYIQAYKAQSDGIKPLHALLDTLNVWLNNDWDDKCLKTIRELPCMPMYCSETDDKIIQIKNKKKDCNTAFQCVSKSMDQLKALAGSSVSEEAMTKLQDAIKDSCEKTIKTFEDLVKETKSKKTGGVSSVKISISLILTAVLFSLKMFW